MPTRKKLSQSTLVGILSMTHHTADAEQRLVIPCLFGMVFDEHIDPSKIADLAAEAGLPAGCGAEIARGTLLSPYVTVTNFTFGVVPPSA